MSAQTVISFGIKKFIERHKSIFGSLPSKEITNKVKKQFQDGASSHEENRLLYSLSDDGRVEFFVLSNVVFIGEYGRKFLTFPMMYCSSKGKIRKKFYQSIRDRAMELSSSKDVKDLAVWCHFDDALSAKHFKIKGTLNMIQLVGDVNATLAALKIGVPHETRRLRLADVRFVSRIELLAHKHDSSSRMHQVTGKKDALKKFADFGKMLVKKANAFVSLDGNKITGIGAVFPDKKNKVANIATIAVHPRYTGRGIAKSLYREMFGSLKEAGISKYVGHSSTDTILGMAKKMKRVEFSRAYTIPIKKFISER